MKQLSDVYFDKTLTKYSISYKQGSMIGDTICPYVKVSQESGRFYKFGKEAFYPEDDVRRPGALSNQVRWGTSSDTYACEEHASRIVIPERIVKNADSEVQIMLRSTEIVINKVKINREKRIKELLVDSGTFNSTTLNAASKWDNYTGATSHPFQNVADAAEAVRSSINMYPTHIIIPAEVAHELSNHPDYIDRVKYTHDNLITVSGIPKTFMGMKVLIPSCSTKSSEDGTTSSTSLWGDNVIVIYVNSRPGLNSINTINTFATVLGKIRKWFYEDRRCYNIEFSQILQEKVVVSGGAYIIKDVLT